MKIKGFDKNLRCNGFQFEIGGEYKIENDGKPLRLCSDTVFHYCDSLQKVHENYPVLTESNRFCEIEVIGEEITDGRKCGSDHIKILREITGEELEILKGKINGNSGIFNTGEGNSGDYNTGDYNAGDNNTGDNNTRNYNTGNYNTGNYNTGNYNAGNRNTGDYNTGDNNTGDYNTGNYNTGNRNTGNYNTGHHNTGHHNTGGNNTGNYNTGDYNTGDYNTGCFCTEEQKILFFDKESDMTYLDWVNSDARYLMNRIDFRLTEWIPENSMTKEEKKKFPTYETTGGYLRTRDLTDCYAEWWEELSNDERKIIKNIPNFDADKFKKITGIGVEG